MRNNLILGAAVAATLAAGSASAANYDVYASGSSALQSFFYQDLQSLFGGGATAPLAAYSYYDSSLASTVGQPAYSAFRVQVANTQSIAGLTTADTITLHYAAELGSLWGIAGALGANAAAQTRAHLEPGGTDLSANNCVASTSTKTTVGITAYNCAGSNFNHVTDTDGGTNMVAARADILLSDVEPVLFAANGGDNWSTANINTALIPTVLGSAPSYSSLTTLAVPMQVLNGQVFEVIGHSLPLPGWSDAATTNNLSLNSLRGIFQGSYTTWNQVPEVGTNDTGSAITICRRDHGSGTEIGASLTFSGTECFGSAVGGQIKGENGTTVIMNPATTDMETCVNGHAGAVGIRTIGTSSKYAVLLINGIQANAHNAAAGVYPYAYEAWGGITAKSGSTIPGLVANTLFYDAQNRASLKSYSSFQETATGAPATTATPRGVYAANVSYHLVTAGAVGAASRAHQADSQATYLSAVTPVALFNRGGSSCAAPVPSNAATGSTN